MEEIGQAPGVPQADEVEVRTSEEILCERDRHYRDLQQRAAGDPLSS